MIPPGQEETLAEMLGRGLSLAGDCKFTGGGVEYQSVKAAYACASGEVALELTHPTNAPWGSMKTERFAIQVRSGSPPAGLLESLQARIRERENGFQWKWIGPHGSSWLAPRYVLLAVAAVALLIASIWAIAQRARTRVR